MPRTVAFSRLAISTVRNRCFDYSRRLAGGSRLEDVQASRDEADGPAALGRDGTRTGCKGALAQLPPVLREALSHYVDGMPYGRGLAARPRSALKMRVHRARQALSMALGGNKVTDEPPESSLYQVR